MGGEKLNTNNNEDPNFGPVYKGGTVPTIAPRNLLRRPSRDEVLVEGLSPVILVESPMRMEKT